MKKSVISIVFAIFLKITLFAQGPAKIDGKIVFSNDDVVFHQIDDHTWVGSGHEMWHESLYLVEGSDKAVLIDAGTNIKNLDKIVATITKKPVMLVATHVHPDHIGSANYFPEIYINPSDTVLIPKFMPNYKGVIKYLKDREIINLGDRQLEVVFTPAHTPGSTTFIDKKYGYGFSGDSFGTGLLLLFGNFSTFISSCEKICSIMENDKIKYLYSGHYNDNNMETLKKINDMIALSKDVLSGKVKGKENPDNRFQLKLIVTGNGYSIDYNESSLK